MNHPGYLQIVHNTFLVHTNKDNSFEASKEIPCFAYKTEFIDVQVSLFDFWPSLNFLSKKIGYLTLYMCYLRWVA